ncbi:unnamed protein product, partial [Symbiodinium pilosum]
VGDALWYERCEGHQVEAKLVEMCWTSSTCWVQYHVERPRGGWQNRRALVKLEELMRVQQDRDRQLSCASSMASEEQQPVCEAGWISEGYTPTVGETMSMMSAHPASRSRAFSMVVSDDEDSVAGRSRQRPQRAFSMVVSDDEDEPCRRTRATSMVLADNFERDTAVSMIFSEASGDLGRRRTRATSMVLADDFERDTVMSMIFSESSGDSGQKRGAALSMLSEIPELWTQREHQREPAPSSEITDHWTAFESDHPLPPKSPSASELSQSTPETLPSPEPSINCGKYCDDPAAWPSAQWTMPELVGLEPEHVDVFWNSARDTCRTCPLSLVAHTTDKVEKELSELCRLLENKAASLASTSDDADHDSGTASSKPSTCEEDPDLQLLAPVQNEVSMLPEEEHGRAPGSEASGSPVVAAKGDGQDREFDADAYRVKKPGLMDRVLRNLCPSLAKS